jgi:hypothetical protein
MIDSVIENFRDSVSFAGDPKVIVPRHVRLTFRSVPFRYMVSMDSRVTLTLILGLCKVNVGDLNHVTWR